MHRERRMFRPLAAIISTLSSPVQSPLIFSMHIKQISRRGQQKLFDPDRINRTSTISNRWTLLHDQPLRRDDVKLAAEIKLDHWWLILLNVVYSEYISLYDILNIRIDRDMWMFHSCFFHHLFLQLRRTRNKTTEMAAVRTDSEFV